MDSSINLRPRPITYFIAFLALNVGGCGIWESNLHPDYRSTRADYICHPYGDCSSGKWVPMGSWKTEQPEASASHALCAQEIDRGHDNMWWKESVTRGLEIGECMEQLGFRLQQ